MLGLKDVIPIGKLASCRVCDVIEDHYQYLQWLVSKGLIKLDPQAEEAISDYITAEAAARYYDEEIAPYMPNYHESQRYKDMFHDVPY